ncbi:addiction module protein [Humisphaera borealis]|uniref:Addiction module protein n=1 Tax=Humisphaera borealis TaxID=2807512 RepID=A0A7M2WUL2_9BACT|nr:addiction module protein [Humisphaera borealis]QOV88491.1 addiction module protein [Humisphaera borealis]
MVARDLINDVLALPTNERIELYDRLRESIRNDPALDPLSDELKRLLDDRHDDLMAHPGDESDWEDVHARALDLLKAR